MNERKDNISWDEFFMGVAMLCAQRSKDPSTQVGACIVGENKHILSTGYNGMPVGCSDEIMPWGKTGEGFNSKYYFVCHAELNAILNSGGKSLSGATLYSTLFPCNECAKAIVQVGIRKVVFFSNKHENRTDYLAAKHIFQLAKVEIVPHKLSGKEIKLKV